MVKMLILIIRWWHAFAKENAKWGLSKILSLRYQVNARLSAVLFMYLEEKQNTDVDYYELWMDKTPYMKFQTAVNSTSNI